MLQRNTIAAAMAILIMAWSPSALAHPPWFSCWHELFGRVELQVDEEAVLYRGAPVTGDVFYPTDLVLSNLGLTPETIDGLKGKKVVSVGEGFSGLLPYLREAGVRAVAQDVWYRQKNLPDNWVGELMKRYVSKNRRQLMTADATKVIPLWPRSQDLVVSHMLVNNLTFREGLYVVANAINVTKPGGEIRIFGFEPETASDLTTVLQNVFGKKMTFRLIEREFRYGRPPSEIVRRNLLLLARVRDKTRGAAD